MRQDSKIIFKKKGEVIAKRYYAAPSDIINFSGCDFEDDIRNLLEEYTFTDQFNNIGKMWLEIGFLGILTLQIKMSGDDVVYIHDQFLETVQIAEKANTIIIGTKESVINFVVWPKLSVKITRNRIQNYDIPLAN